MRRDSWVLGSDSFPISWTSFCPNLSSNGSWNLVDPEELDASIPHIWYFPTLIDATNERYTHKSQDRNRGNAKLFLITDRWSHGQETIKNSRKCYKCFELPRTFRKIHTGIGQGNGQIGQTFWNPKFRISDLTSNNFSKLCILWSRIEPQAYNIATLVKSYRHFDSRQMQFSRFCSSKSKMLNTRAIE